MSNEQPSAIEVQNAKRILDFLSETKGVSYETLREDIFAVKNAETGVTCIVDVEPTLVFLSVEICDVPEENQAELNDFMMELNGKAIHGKFCKLAGKYFFRDYLEFANLDFNELEASLKWAFLMVGANVQKIASIHATGEIGDDIDLESDDIDLEDLMETGEVVADLLINTVAEMGDKEVQRDEQVAPVEVVEKQSVSVGPSSAPDTFDSVGGDSGGGDSGDDSGGDDSGGDD
jgi:hypothetical protein